VNIAIYFIRARSSLILSCSSKGFPIYSLFSEKKEEERGRYKGKRERKGKNR